MNTYNGYSNKPTWLLVLWIDNEEGLPEFFEDCKNSSDFESLANELFLENSPDTGLLSDLISFVWGSIDFEEAWKSIKETLGIDDDDTSDDDDDDDDDDTSDPS